MIVPGFWNSCSYQCFTFTSAIPRSCLIQAPIIPDIYEEEPNQQDSAAVDISDLPAAIQVHGRRVSCCGRRREHDRATCDKYRSPSLSSLRPVPPYAALGN